MPKECWAKGFSECSDKFSKEHYVSQAAFEQQFVYVTGMSWCRGEEKKVSLSSLASKILCTHHNSNLSKVDRAGGNAVRLFDEILPEQYRSVRTPAESRVIHGLDFERWLLKIAINVSYGGDMHIGVGMTDSKPEHPSSYLLEVLFGNLDFSHKMGLYTLCYETLEKFQVGKISVCPIHQDGSVAGFVFHVRGLDFFLSLYPGHAPPPLKTLGLETGSGISGHILNASPVYRKNELVSVDSEGKAKSVRFDWNA